jgi:hypothetical protein
MKNLQRQEQTTSQKFEFKIAEHICYSKSFTHCLLKAINAKVASNNTNRCHQKFDLDWADLADDHLEVFANDILHLHGVEYKVWHQKHQLKQKIVEAENIAEPEGVASLLQSVKSFINDAADWTSIFHSAGTDSVHDIELTEPLYTGCTQVE